MALWQLDEFKPAPMLRFIRSVPEPPGNQRARWLPDQMWDDLAFEYLKGANQRQVMAHVMGFDSEAPIHGRPGMGERVQGELTPIKRKARIGEKELARFYTPRAGTGDQASAIRAVFTTAGELARTIMNRLEWLSMQALSEDAVVYDEGGVVFSFDYGLNDAFQFDWPTGNDDSGAAVGPAAGELTDTANFDPLPWLNAQCDRMEQQAGFRPQEWVVSARALQLLTQNVALRQLIRGTGDGVSGTTLTQGEINTVLTQYRLPTIYTYDRLISKEEADGTYTETRTMAENKSFFVPGFNVGNVLFGPTAESRVLVGTPQAVAQPGIWGSTYGTDEPPAEWVKAAAVAFPTLPEAGKIGQATLWTAA